MSLNTGYYILIFLLMTLLGSLGAISLKIAINKNCKHLLLNTTLYIGVFFYILSILLNIYLLYKFDYTLVLPLSSITYVWTLLIAAKLLNEKITFNKILGIILIIIGVTIIFVFH